MSDLESTKKYHIVHPLLFAIFPVLFLYSQNKEYVPVVETLLPAAVTVIFMMLLMLILGLALRNYEKAAIIVSLFLILFFSYGHIFRYGWGELRVVRHRYLIPASGVLYICGVCALLRMRRGLRNFTRFLNFFSIFLVAFSVTDVGIYKIKTIGDLPHGTDRIEVREKGARVLNTGKSPDIYYIIFDRYGSSGVMKEYYDYDNSEFIDFLSETGFYVASESKANYLKTVHSLASSLNMEYINYLCDELGEECNNWAPLHSILQDYKVWRFLRSRGYKFVHFGSWYNATHMNKYADINISYSHALPEFMSVLYRTTILAPVIDRFGFNDHQIHYNRVLFKFKKLADMARIKEPKFVFAHMLTPHAPYVFDRNGDFLTPELRRRLSQRERYIEQIICINEMIEELVETLLSDSEMPPVIVLQSDEGPLPRRYARDELNFNWNTAREGECREKMGILNAYYLPGVDKAVLYPEISPVNTFRVIFNLYFDTRHALLPDRCYAFEDQKHPYKFFDVTDKTK